MYSDIEGFCFCQIRKRPKVFLKYFNVQICIKLTKIIFKNEKKLNCESFMLEHLLVGVLLSTFHMVPQGGAISVAD
jgi:hypothetical protein